MNIVPKLVWIWVILSISLYFLLVQVNGKDRMSPADYLHGEEREIDINIDLDLEKRIEVNFPYTKPNRKNIELEENILDKETSGDTELSTQEYVFPEDFLLTFIFSNSTEYNSSVPYDQQKDQEKVFIDGSITQVNFRVGNNYTNPFNTALFYNWPKKRILLRPELLKKRHLENNQLIKRILYANIVKKSKTPKYYRKYNEENNSTSGSNNSKPGPNFSIHKYFDIYPRSFTSEIDIFVPTRGKTFLYEEIEGKQPMYIVFPFDNRSSFMSAPALKAQEAIFINENDIEFFFVGNTSSHEYDEIYMKFRKYSLPKKVKDIQKFVNAVDAAVFHQNSTSFYFPNTPDYLPITHFPLSINQNFSCEAYEINLFNSFVLMDTQKEKVYIVFDRSLPFDMCRKNINVLAYKYNMYNPDGSKLYHNLLSNKMIILISKDNPLHVEREEKVLKKINKFIQLFKKLRKEKDTRAYCIKKDNIQFAIGMYIFCDSYIETLHINSVFSLQKLFKESIQDVKKHILYINNEIRGNLEMSFNQKMLENFRLLTSFSISTTDHKNSIEQQGMPFMFGEMNLFQYTFSSKIEDSIKILDSIPADFYTKYHLTEDIFYSTAFLLNYIDNRHKDLFAFKQVSSLIDYVSLSQYSKEEKDAAIYIFNIIYQAKATELSKSATQIKRVQESAERLYNSQNPKIEYSKNTLYSLFSDHFTTIKRDLSVAYLEVDAMSKAFKKLSAKIKNDWTDILPQQQFMPVQGNMDAEKTNLNRQIFLSRQYMYTTILTTVNEIHRSLESPLIKHLMDIYTNNKDLVYYSDCIRETYNIFKRFDLSKVDIKNLAEIADKLLVKNMYQAYKNILILFNNEIEMLLFDINTNIMDIYKINNNNNNNSEYRTKVYKINQLISCINSYSKNEILKKRKLFNSITFLFAEKNKKNKKNYNSLNISKDSAESFYKKAKEKIEYLIESEINTLNSQEQPRAQNALKNLLSSNTPIKNLPIDEGYNTYITKSYAFINKMYKEQNTLKTLPFSFLAKDPEYHTLLLYNNDARDTQNSSSPKAIENPLKDNMCFANVSAILGNVENMKECQEYIEEQNITQISTSSIANPNTNYSEMIINIEKTLTNRILISTINEMEKHKKQALSMCKDKKYVVDSTEIDLLLFALEQEVAERRSSSSIQYLGQEQEIEKMQRMVALAVSKGYIEFLNTKENSNEFKYIFDGSYEITLSDLENQIRYAILALFEERKSKIDYLRDIYYSKKKQAINQFFISRLQNTTESEEYKKMNNISKKFTSISIQTVTLLQPLFNILKLLNVKNKSISAISRSRRKDTLINRVINVNSWKENDRIYKDMLEAMHNYGVQMIKKIEEKISAFEVCNEAVDFTENFLNSLKNKTDTPDNLKDIFERVFQMIENEEAEEF